MIKERHVTLYSLECDNCGNVFEDPYTDGVEYEDEDLLESDAEDDGWLALHGGKKRGLNEPEELRKADNHFCCEICRKEWLEKHAVAEPKGKFCPAPDSGAGPLPRGIGEPARVSYVDGVDGHQPGEKPDEI